VLRHVSGDARDTRRQLATIVAEVARTRLGHVGTALPYIVALAVPVLHIAGRTGLGEVAPFERFLADDGRETWVFSSDGPRAIAWYFVPLVSLRRVRAHPLLRAAGGRAAPDVGHETTCARVSGRSRHADQASLALPLLIAVGSELLIRLLP
jgi:hypothetical protein